jgi:hypothetical protein
MDNQDPRATPAGIAYVRRRQAQARRVRPPTHGLRTLEEIEAERDEPTGSLWPVLMLALLGLAVAIAVYLVG